MTEEDLKNKLYIWCSNKHEWEKDHLEMLPSGDFISDKMMIHSKEKSGEDIKQFCQTIKKEYPTIPIVAVPTTYNKITEQELNSWGVNIVIYANHLIRSAYPSMHNTAVSILENERSSEAEKFCMPIKEILELIPGTK